MKKRFIARAWLLAVTLVSLAFSLVSVPAAGAQEKPVVRFILFYRETCPHCHDVMEDYLPTVYEKYGDQVEYRYIETSESVKDNQAMHGLELKLGVPAEKFGFVPALVIGDKVLIGADEIPALLETYIDDYLAQGGVDYPSLENLPQPVEMLIFLDSSDTDVIEKLQAFFSPLNELYGPWLRLFFADLSQDEAAKALADYHAALGVPESPPGILQILIGSTILLGMDEIEGRLPGLIETHKQQGGIQLLTLEELTGQAPPVTPQPTQDVDEPPQKPIYVAYFDQAGCQICSTTTDGLAWVQDEYPQLVIETFPIEDNKALNEWLSQKYGVPEEKHLSTPMVFIGDDVLVGTEASFGNLMIIVAKYASTGAERNWDDFDPSVAENSLIDRFKSFGWLTVLGAGLIDGLNPCAFATLVFFISYLTFSGRRGREVLFVGASFALGVFATYLLVGVGLLKAVQSFSFFTALGRWVYLITALLCMLLASLTFRDFLKARQGQVSEMALRLPMGLRRRIHRVIRENAQVQAFVALALVTGFVVSLLELACTGQVYLPTIMFVLSVPDLAAQAFLYLLLYCLMFIAPLIVVFILSYFGTTSEQLGQFINRHTATVKLFTGLLFVGLALWMTWTLAPLFGAHAPWDWVLLGVVVLIIALGMAVLFLFEKPSAKGQRRRRKKTARRTQR